MWTPNVGQTDEEKLQSSSEKAFQENEDGPQNATGARIGFK